jgi:ASC-1-like (ASCH) protein
MEENKEKLEQIEEYEKISDEELELLVKTILVRNYGAFKELAK